MEYEFGGIVNDRSAVVRLEDNVVVNIIVAPPTEPAQLGCYLVDVSDGKFCNIGWVWNGTEFYDPDPQPFPEPVQGEIVSTGDIINQLISTNPNSAKVHDQVYVDGVMVREDISICLPEAAPVLALLKETFPDSDVDFESTPTNFIGVYDGYRPPYTNESISWYEMKAPSKELLAKYQIPEGMYPDIYSWYGLKHNIVTKDIMLKVVFKGTSLDASLLPELPNIQNSFFARLHRIDGTVEPYVDCYCPASESEIIDYCNRHNVPYTTVRDKPGNIWTYGITFNSDTKEIITVKSYKRVFGD